MAVFAAVAVAGCSGSEHDASFDQSVSTTVDMGCQRPQPAIVDAKPELLKMIGGRECDAGADGLGMTGWRPGLSMPTHHGTLPIHVATNPLWTGTVGVSETPAPDIFAGAPTDAYVVSKGAAGNEIRPPKGDGCRVLMLRFSSTRPAVDVMQYFVVWDKQGSSDCVASAPTTTTLVR